MSESIVDHILRTADRNAQMQREIQWARRLIWLIAAAAFAAGYAVRGIAGNVL